VPYSSFKEEVIDPDPYLEVYGADNGAPTVKLNVERLARWGQSSPLPSYGRLVQQIDATFADDTPAGLAACWLAKGLAAAANPQAALWSPSAAARAAAGDAAYRLPLEKAQDLVDRSFADHVAHGNGRADGVTGDAAGDAGGGWREPPEVEALVARVGGGRSGTGRLLFGLGQFAFGVRGQYVQLNLYSLLGLARPTPPPPSA
jgi:hypothetical protein